MASLARPQGQSACHAREAGASRDTLQSVEEVPPFRILEVPLWMLDAAACCNIRAAKSGVANVESLRAVKALLRSTPEADLELAIPAQHPYWLDPGGADVRVANSTEIDSTRAVCSPASETELAGTVPRDSTQDSANANAAYCDSIVPDPEPRRRPRRRAMSEKIKSHHLERKAILMCASLLPIRSTTTWRAKSCSMRCRNDCVTWVGMRLRSSMKIAAIPLPGTVTRAEVLQTSPARR